MLYIQNTEVCLKHQCSDSLSLNDVIKPIDLLYVHNINNSYFKSLTILDGVVHFSLITYELKIQNPMRFIIMLIPVYSL